MLLASGLGLGTESRGTEEYMGFMIRNSQRWGFGNLQNYHFTIQYLYFCLTYLLPICLAGWRCNTNTSIKQSL
jgi:hypothetical protein